MELDANNQGMECLRVLNEIIADFDEVSYSNLYVDEVSKSRVTKVWDILDANTQVMDI